MLSQTFLILQFITLNLEEDLSAVEPVSQGPMATDHQKC
jgi:hypothetical protein